MPVLDHADEEPMEHAPNAVEQPSDGDDTDDGTPVEVGPTPINWRVSDEPNPFQRRLIVTVEDAPVLDLILDPLVVQHIVAALMRVHSDQRAALGLTPPSALAPSYVSPESIVTSLPEMREDPEDAGVTEYAGVTEDVSAADTSEVPERAAGSEAAPVETGGPLSALWWRQHKLLAFLLIFAAVFFAFGTISGTH